MNFIKKTLNIGVLTLALYSGCCISNTSEHKYTGTVLSKDYYVWETSLGDTYVPSFKLLLKLEDGKDTTINFSDYASDIRQGMYTDVKNRVEINGIEKEANKEIKNGDLVEITVKQHKILKWKVLKNAN
jgi:hypothetical protein